MNWGQGRRVLPSYYGWTIAGLGLMAAALSSPGQSFALSFYLEPLMAEVGISRLAISSLYSGATLLAALTLPLFGAWADRTTGGRFLGTILLLMAGALVLLATTQTFWMLAAALFALRLLGQGAIGIGTLTMTVRWFDRRRGRAFALVALGYAAGEVLFPTTILRLFDFVGWRGSLLLFAAAYLVFFAPIAFRVGRDPGEAETAVEAAGGPDAVPVRSYTLGAALRTPVFHGLAAVLTLSPLIVTAVIFHQVGLFESLGRGPESAARAMIGFGIAAVSGTYLAGFLVERVNPRAAIALSLLPLAAGLALLAAAPLWGPAPFVYGAFLGASAGALKISGSLVWPAYFGSAHVGSIKGAVATIRNASTAAGPLLATLLAGPNDVFQRMLLPFAAAAALGACLSLALRPPRRLEWAEGDGDATGRAAAA
jgi:MFS family permease